MNAATRDRLIAEGRTRWFCVTIATEGRRFTHSVHTWARDAEDATARIVLREGQTIAGVEQQHR